MRHPRTISLPFPAFLCLTFLALWLLLGEKVIAQQLNPFTKQDSNTGSFFYRIHGTDTTNFKHISRQIPLVSPRIPIPERIVVVNSAMTLTVTVTNTTCQLRTGTIIATVTGGTPPYIYALSNGWVYNYGYFITMYAGSYVLTVTDHDGQTISTPVTITNTFDPPILISNTYQVSNNCNGPTASTTLFPTGGTPPYSYTYDNVNYQSSNTFSNLYPGSYYFTVRDANGCTSELSSFYMDWFVNFNCPSHVNVSGSSASCTNEGSLTIYTNPGYVYSVDGINYQSDGHFGNLPPGLNLVYYKNITTGHVDTVAAAIPKKCFIKINSVSTDADCQQNNGTVTITTTNGTPPYLYTLDGVNYQSSNVFTGLASGSYFVTVIDNTSNRDSRGFVINNKCPTVSLEATDEGCGHNDAIITATPTKGTAPYQYSLDGINFQSSNLFTGLAAGHYTVTIKDALDFTGTSDIDVSYYCLSVSAISTNVVCSNTNGTITVTASNGTPPYKYSLDGINFQTSNTFTALAAAAYTVTVKDQLGKIATTNVSITDSPAPQIAYTIAPPSCTLADGTITITGTGGTNPLEYSIDDINFQPANVFTNKSSGSYTLVIRDANGCKATASATLTVSCPAITSTTTASSCGQSNGEIDITVTNAVAPYQYSLDAINFQSTNIFNGLIPGIYTITVKDVYGHTNTATATISNSCPLVTAVAGSATCNLANGTITATGSAGTAPYEYSIDGVNYQSNPVFTSLGTGVYTVNIKDATGAISNTSVTVNKIPDDLILQMQATTAICEGTSITLNNTSNADHWQWAPAPGLTNDHILNPDVSPVGDTKYYLTASLGGCSKKDSVLITVNKAPVAIAGAGSIICKGQNSHLNGRGGVDYLWTPATYLSNPRINDPDVIAPPVSMAYSLQVTDANGCKSLLPSSVKVTVTTTTKVFAGGDTSIIMNQPFRLYAKDVNNSGFIQYTWSPVDGLDDPGAQSPITILDKDVTYIVNALTADGCAATDEIKVKVYVGPEIYVPTAFSPGNDGRNDVLRAIPVGIKAFRYFAVYNRWGQRIFYTSNPSMGWDGRSGGVSLSTDSFVWIAEGIDDKGKLIQKKGTVTLIR